MIVKWQAYFGAKVLKGKRGFDLVSGSSHRPPMHDQSLSKRVETARSFQQLCTKLYYHDNLDLPKAHD